MNKSIVRLIIIGLIAVIAAITNPNQSRHKEVLEDKFKACMQKSMDKDNGLAVFVGNLIGNAIISKLIDTYVSVDNYVLFSTTKLTWEGETRIIGIGAFGNVFFDNQLDEEQIKELMKKGKVNKKVKQIK